MNLNTALVNLLIQKKYHIAFAESCTGGLAAAGIVDVPDASKVLGASFITYSNDAKIRLVNVSPDTLNHYSAISREVAAEMAKGAAESAYADIGCGITGIAGPGSYDSLPEGLVCFGIYVSANDYIKTYEINFGAIGRENVRNESVRFLYSEVIKILDSQPSD